jgi:hypothetical protein
MSPHGRVPFHEPLDAAADGWFAPLLGPHLPTGFSRRVTVLHPDEHYPLDAPQWRRSLILVTHGLVEITTASGDHARFPAGSILTFDELPTAAATNVGDTDAVLVSLSRTPIASRPDDFRPPAASHREERPTPSGLGPRDGPATGN